MFHFVAYVVIDCPSLIRTVVVRLVSVTRVFLWSSLKGLTVVVSHLFVSGVVVSIFEGR